MAPAARPPVRTPAADAGFLAHCLELLAPLGPMRSRRMFGGHGLYCGDVFCALIAFERLYLKTDAGTAPRFEAAGSRPFLYEGKGRSVTMSYHEAPAEAMDSPALMLPWARLALQAALSARAARPAAAKPGAPRRGVSAASKAAAKPKAPRRRDGA
jgi:DNA transformation protein